MIIKDKIKGALYGIAVGDALGAPLEGWGAKSIMDKFGVIKDLQQFDAAWALGEFTDDTWLTLATARAYDDDIEFVPEKAGAAMVIWMRANGKGIGGLTNKALANISSGRTDIYNSGKKALASSGNRGAGNGSLMRCIATGLVHQSHGLDDIIRESTILSEITHSDPRCVAACVGYNVIVAGLLEDKGFSELAKYASDIVKPINEETALVFLGKANGDPHSYDTNDRREMGYVLKALDRALVALRDGELEQQLIQIVNEGGDVDTNAAIAGGLLGAKFGFSAIPQRWIDPLMNKDEIDEAVEVLNNYRER